MSNIITNIEVALQKALDAPGWGETKRQLMNAKIMLQHIGEQPEPTDAHDRKFLDWLHDQSCCVSGWPGPCDPAHTFKSIHGGGIGRKSLRAVPLAHNEHLKQSGMPELSYWLDALKRNPVLLKKMVGLLGEDYQRQYEASRAVAD